MLVFLTQPNTRIKNMAKASGSTRVIKPIPVSTKTLHDIFNELIKTGSYDINKSFVDDEKGAYYLQAKDREPDENEKIAAMFFVKKGISVAITPEGDFRFATAKKPDGTPKFSDGLISVHIYEQKTIEKDAVKIKNNFKKAIQHAVDKKAEIAFIFDRYGKGHRNQVKEAMQEYKLPAWGKLPKRVIVMNKDGDFFEHYF